MGKIAFLFAGQGAQYSGMGRELAEISPAAKTVFTRADELRPGTSSQCFTGSEEELAVTANTQPCLYCVDLAAARALEEAGVHADFAAGFSLGEIAALTFAGVFSDREGFGFVCKRALAMQAAAERHPGGMAAVLKLSNEQAEAICAEFTQVYPVNYNCPGQLVAAGDREELTRFAERVAEEKGRAKLLKVGGGFHSPFMDEAADALRPVLDGMTLQAPRLPVYANLDAAPYQAEQAKSYIANQINHPVRWQETLEKMAAAGADTFIEVGPGKTLSGLVKKTVGGARILNVQDAESLRAAVKEIVS